MGSVERVGDRLTVARHNIDRTSGIAALEAFWSAMFKRRDDVAVITTNYDVLAERGMRHIPRPRVSRPGFHYGFGPEGLSGGGYPSYSHIQKVTASGHVPLLKIHGSVSWSIIEGRLVRYHDCRPAIRGNPAIVAPVTHKSLPAFLEPTWQVARECLAKASTLVVVGYSLPSYDRLVCDLLSESVRPGATVHVLDPDPLVARRFEALLPKRVVHAHAGLPQGTTDLSVGLG